MSAPRPTAPRRTGGRLTARFLFGSIGGTRPQDGAQSFNLVHVYDETVVHSVVPVDVVTPLEYIDAAEAQRRLVEAGIATAPATRSAAFSAVQKDAPTEPLTVLR